jgi:hypothetical protein
MFASDAYLVRGRMFCAVGGMGLILKPPPGSRMSRQNHPEAPLHPSRDISISVRGISSKLPVRVAHHAARSSTSWEVLTMFSLPVFIEALLVAV